MKTLIFLLTLILVSPVLSTAWEDESLEFCFENDTKQKTIYWLWWVDHTVPNYEPPFNIAGGELNPSERICLEYKYPAGVYEVRWKGDDPFRFRIWVFNKEGFLVLLKRSKKELIVTR